MEQRSTINLANLQEMLDAGASVGNTLAKGQAQYFTPYWVAEMLRSGLPQAHAHTFVIDPQCGEGGLLRAFEKDAVKVGIDIDRNVAAKMLTVTPDSYTGNCVEFWKTLDSLYPGTHFRVQVANPPFALMWRTPHGTHDSTVYTWSQMLGHAGMFGCGYMLANADTIERHGLNKDRRVYLYINLPNDTFPGVRFRPGVLFFHGSFNGNCREELISGPVLLTNYVPRLQIGGTDAEACRMIIDRTMTSIAEERRGVPDFNVYLDVHGYLRTYLSIREQINRKFTDAEVKRLASINCCHPLTLTVDRETRLLLEELIAVGAYRMQPEARHAITKALEERRLISCPIMDVTDFERVAYADDDEALVAAANNIRPKLTKGRRYPTRTGTYAFSKAYKKMRLHLNERKNATFAAEHDMTLSGQDKYIEFTDDRGTKYRMMERPRKAEPTDISDSRMWELFEKPFVPTVATEHPDKVAQNLAVMEAAELLAGFTYYQGQRDFYARVAVRDYALVAAATGTGKTLGAITLIALKAPVRALIVAPQGTTRGRKVDEENEDEIDDVAASQWLTELRRFAPGLQVFELFSLADYHRIKTLNGGVLPHGVYVSYYEAMFSNGARESHKPRSKYDDGTFAKEFDLPPPEKPDECGHFLENVGEERNGIRCIVEPCMATLIGHEFDFVALDEAHKMCHLSANVTQMIVRMQPRFRYALTATPIPNLVSDIFPLMGWLCVPNWFRGKIRNAAWPYAKHEAHRFSSTFLSIERDHTQERMNKDLDPKNRGKVQRISPEIASAARLLRLLKPSIAYISKEQCNPEKPKCTVHDVRVPMSKSQAQIYGHYMNRANVPHHNPMVRASLQLTILRDLCAAPATSRWNRRLDPRVMTNFNHKAVSVLGLVKDILNRGEQAVIVSARMSQTDFIEQSLQQAGIPTGRIDSSMTPEHHSATANAFKAKRFPIMFMGIKCAQAHSFDQCVNLIIMSLEYTWGSFDQATGRIDRVSSRLPMNVYCVLTRNSIEEIMFDMVATKGDAATICLRGERVPREFVASDPADILARNFMQFDPNEARPDEKNALAIWPTLRAGLSEAWKKHPCQVTTTL